MTNEQRCKVHTVHGTTCAWGGRPCTQHQALCAVSTCSFVRTLQVQSNALAALEAIDPEVAEEVLREGTITGDRINGLCDGLTGEW